MYVYKITNNITKKIYIGKQVRNNKNYMGSGKLIKLSISKYGTENFIKEIVEVCHSKKELSEREIFWISFYNSQDPKIGYNISNGGDGNSNNKHRIGKKLSETHKKKISLNHHDVSGEKNPMFGKKHTDESKEKISIKRKGLKLTEATIEKFKIRSSGENNSNSKLTELMVKEIRTEYNCGVTIKELSLKHNVKPPCIWKIIKRITWKCI